MASLLSVPAGSGPGAEEALVLISGSLGDVSEEASERQPGSSWPESAGLDEGPANAGARGLLATAADICACFSPILRDSDSCCGHQERPAWAEVYLK